MGVPGLHGAVHGKAWKTTIPDATAEQPADLVQRQFQADRPNQLWVADFTYVATWAGVVFVAFVINVFTRRIVGWRVTNSMRTDQVLDTLEQAPQSRTRTEGLVHHSDRGSQYLLIRYSESLAEAGVESSVGSVGDSYDNALAESIIGLFKAEVIRRRGPQLTTNKGIDTWPDILSSDEILATAILERHLHHSHVLNIKVRSYRLREMESKLAATA